jgi:hypothetical protein
MKANEFIQRHNLDLVVRNYIDLMFSDIQNALFIESGDISPYDLVTLENLQQDLTELVAKVTTKQLNQ